MLSTTMTGLVAGSHQRNELHVVHGNEEPRPPTRQSASKTCRVCGDEIGFRDDGGLFVACHECGFPVCRPCYEYERGEGNQCCPQCNTRYKRHKGCPRVAGDEEDDGGADDFEDEFQIKSHRDTPYPHVVNPSENGDYNQQKWQPGGPVFSSIAGSITGKDFEGEKEMYNNDEWKERVEKWKSRQEKRGLISKEDGGGNDQGEEDDFL